MCHAPVVSFYFDFVTALNTKPLGLKNVQIHLVLNHGPHPLQKGHICKVFSFHQTFCNQD